MNGKTKALLTTLVFLAFVGLCFWWWSNKKKECGDCNASNSNTTTTTTTTTTTSNDLPLSFNWNKSNAIQGSGFANYRNEQIKNLGPTDTLQIKTWYYDGEENGEQLALQRADSIKALYTNVSNERIKVITEKRTSEDRFKTEKFIANELTVLPNTNSLVKKTGNKVTIYFASNSSAKNIEKEIDDYLNTLVAEMKTNPSETVTASGHTDNVGDDAKNLTLSQGRADFVKNIMTQKGADGAKISTVGKGETEPIATNDTEDGRKLNRRVELIINNQ